MTGLGAITPLGVGVRTTWNRLLAGDSGITSIAHWEPQQRWRELPSTVSGLVPRDEWRPSDWLSATDQRRLPTFVQYAMASAQMALDDAGWHPTRPEDRAMTGVCMGSGIGNLEEMYETSLAFQQDVSFCFIAIFFFHLIFCILTLSCLSFLFAPERNT